ncbi:MAG: hypothetical protein K1X74_04345 [Pirellulales bacterium]|nr:hypothetical protein [Pirellulales bacterium]
MSATTKPAPRASRNSRPILFRALAVGLGVLIAGLGVELILRVTGFEPTQMLSKRNLRRIDGQTIGYHCYPSNPHGEFDPLPDLSVGSWELFTYSLPPQPLPLESVRETPYCVRYDHSPQGYRDAEYPKTTPPGKLRIACVGDSFVWGEGVKPDGTLPAQLAGLLGNNVEVINCGKVGADLSANLSNVYKAQLLLAPQRILFCFLVNDVKLTPELEQRQEYINDLIIFRDVHLARHQARSWYASSVLLRWLGTQWDLRSMHGSTLQWYRDSYDPQFNRVNLEAMATQFLELGSLPGCKVAVVLYPLLENLEGGYPLATIHDQVRKLAMDAGLPTLDLAPKFIGKQTEQLWVHESDHHPNRQAQQIASAAVAEWLVHDVPQFLNPSVGTELPPPSTATGPSPPLLDQAVGQALQLIEQQQFLAARRLVADAARRNPSDPTARVFLGYLAFLEQRTTDAVAHYREALRLFPNWPDTEINLAAILASHPDPKIRDTAEAVRLAEKAFGATDHPPLTMLDTLMVAYGEDGRYAECIATGERGMKEANEANQPAVADTFRKRLDIYRQKQQQAAAASGDAAAGQQPAGAEPAAAEPSGAEPASGEQSGTEPAPSGEQPAAIDTAPPTADAPTPEASGPLAGEPPAESSPPSAEPSPTPQP